MRYLTPLVFIFYACPTLAQKFIKNGQFKDGISQWEVSLSNQEKPIKTPIAFAYSHHPNARDKQLIVLVNDDVVFTHYPKTIRILGNSIMSNYTLPLLALHKS